MIITIVSDVLGEENNGTSIAAANLIRALRAKGHTVRVLCADQYRKGEKDYYVVPNLNLGRPLNAYVRKVGVTLAKSDKKVVESALDGVDIVHIMLPFALGVSALKVAKEKGIPVTAGFHTQAENITSYIGMKRLRPANYLAYKFMYKFMYSKVDAVHYPTKFIKDIFESKVKKSTNGYIISNGVNRHVEMRCVEKPDEFKDRIVITSTGRYSCEKSQDTILKAVKKSRHESEIQVILAGQGVREKYYKKLAKKLTNPPVMKLYEREEIVDVLNFSDLYVHSAEMELEGIACLEAITCGKLTIVSDSRLSATRNFAIDEKCIFKSGDAESLARVIDFWIENPDLRREYEQKYRENAVVYDQDHCMDLMEEMLLEVEGSGKK